MSSKGDSGGAEGGKGKLRPRWSCMRCAARVLRMSSSEQADEEVGMEDGDENIAQSPQWQKRAGSCCD